MGSHLGKVFNIIQKFEIGLAQAVTKIIKTCTKSLQCGHYPTGLNGFKPFFKPSKIFQSLFSEGLLRAEIFRCLSSLNSHYEKVLKIFRKF